MWPTEVVIFPPGFSRLGKHSIVQSLTDAEVNLFIKDVKK